MTIAVEVTGSDDAREDLLQAAAVNLIRNRDKRSMRRMAI